MKKRTDGTGQVGSGRWIGVMVVAAALLTGCSTKTLKVHQVKENDETSRVGVPYPLMFNQFTIEVTRQIEACAESAEVLVKAEIKPLGSRPDPKHIYMIDPNSLAGWTKTSEVKLEYFPSGAPKSLNVVVEDKTGAIVANVAGALSKLALVTGATAGPNKTICTQAVVDALAGVEKLTPQVKSASAVVQSLSDELKQLLLKAGETGAQPDGRAKKKLADAWDALQGAKVRLESQQAKLSKHVKVLTDVDKFVWPRDGGKLNDIFQLRESVFNRWISSPDAKIHSRFDVAVSLDAFTSGAGVRAKTTVETNSGPSTTLAQQMVATSKGIPYRIPVAGAVRVCKGTLCPDPTKDRDVLIGHLEGDLLQLGQVYYLECKSRPFSSIGCAFEMMETGQLKMIGTGHKAALAEGATAAAKAVLSEAMSLKEQLDAIPAKKTQARLAELKAKAELATAEAALLPDDIADKTAVLKAETELMKAEQARIEAEEALRAARVKAGKDGV